MTEVGRVKPAPPDGHTPELRGLHQPYDPEEGVPLLPHAGEATVFEVKGLSLDIHRSRVVPISLLRSEWLTIYAYTPRSPPF